MSAGRAVRGKLVQDPETGYWREEPVRVPGVSARVVAEEVLSAYARGASQGEIAKTIALEAGVRNRSALGTILRDVCQVLLDAGIRSREEERRAPHRRDPEGEGNLPAVLEEVAS